MLNPKTLHLSSKQWKTECGTRFSWNEFFAYFVLADKNFCVLSSPGGHYYLDFCGQAAWKNNKVFAYKKKLQRALFASFYNLSAASKYWVILAINYVHKKCAYKSLIRDSKVEKYQTLGRNIKNYVIRNVVSTVRYFMQLYKTK